MINIEMTMEGETHIKMLGDPYELCAELAEVVKHCAARILDRAKDPVEAGAMIASIITCAIGEAVNECREEAEG